MRKIDTKYFQDYKPVKKKDKDFRKNMFANTLFIDTFNKK